MGQIELPLDADPEWLERCPACGYTDDLSCFDVAGADDNCLFCNQCGCEFDQDTRAVILKPKEPT